MLCGCFRPATQVSGERQDFRTQSRIKTIRKDGKELDLLDLNARRNLDFGIEGGSDSKNLQITRDTNLLDSPVSIRSGFETNNGSILKQ